MTATVAGIHLGLDTHANRPAANTVPDGSQYSCSTHSLIYKSNFAGNSWATWATLGSTAGMTPSTNIVATSQTQTTAVNTWADLATTGPSVTVTVSASGIAVVSIACDMAGSGGTTFAAMAFALSSGNTVAATANQSIFISGATHFMLGATYTLTGLAAGSTVFTAKYNQFGTSGTSTYVNRNITVWV